MARLAIIGASLAGSRVARAARDFGFAGEISLIGAEPHLPYDRSALSTAYLSAPVPPAGPPILRGAASLHSELGVDVRLGRTATALDTEARTVLLDDGGRLGYDAVVIATGSRARSLPGADRLAGVHTLRTVEDARQIRAALDAGARTVVVGAGFTGSEVAASASLRGAPVTLVEALPVPLSAAIGPEMGAACARLHERDGVRLRCGVGVSAIEGEGRVERVRLADGTLLPADLVVLGIGAVPNTSWLARSGLALSGGVLCDAHLRGSAPGVFAAGDVARWVNPLFDSTKPMRLEHWTTAVEQAVAAARNAVAELTDSPASAAPFATVPYFWSDWYDSRIQFVGLPGAQEIQVLVGGARGGWAALYRKRDRLIGAFGVNRPELIATARTLIAQRATWNEAIATLDS